MSTLDDSSDSIVDMAYLYSKSIHYHYQKFAEQTIQKPGRGEDGNDQYDETFIRHFPAEILKNALGDKVVIDTMQDNMITLDTLPNRYFIEATSRVPVTKINYVLTSLNEEIKVKVNENKPLNEIINNLITANKFTETEFKQIFGEIDGITETHIISNSLANSIPIEGGGNHTVEDIQIAINILRDTIKSAPIDKKLKDIVKDLRGETLSILKEILNNNENFCIAAGCQGRFDSSTGDCKIEPMHHNVNNNAFIDLFNHIIDNGLNKNSRYRSLTHVVVTTASAKVAGGIADITPIPTGVEVIAVLNDLATEIKKSPAGNSLAEIIKSIDDDNKKKLLKNILSNHKIVSGLMDGIGDDNEIKIIDKVEAEDAFKILKEKIINEKDNIEPCSLPFIMSTIEDNHKKRFKNIKNAFINDLTYNNMIKNIETALEAAKNKATENMEIAKNKPYLHIQIHTALDYICNSLPLAVYTDANNEVVTGPGRAPHFAYSHIPTIYNTPLRDLKDHIDAINIVGVPQPLLDLKTETIRLSLEVFDVFVGSIFLATGTAVTIANIKDTEITVNIKDFWVAATICFTEIQKGSLNIDILITNIKKCIENASKINNKALILKKNKNKIEKLILDFVPGGVMGGVSGDVLHVQGAINRLFNGFHGGPTCIIAYMTTILDCITAENLHTSLSSLNKDDIINAFEKLKKAIRTSPLQENLSSILDKNLYTKLDSKTIMLQEFFGDMGSIPVTLAPVPVPALVPKPDDYISLIIEAINEADKTAALNKLKNSIILQKSLYENIMMIEPDQRKVLLNIFRTDINKFNNGSIYRTLDRNEKPIPTVPVVPGAPGAPVVPVVPVVPIVIKQINKDTIEEMFKELSDEINSKKYENFEDIFKTPLQILEIVFRNNEFVDVTFNLSTSIKYAHNQTVGSIQNKIKKAFYSLQSSLVTPFLEILKKNKDFEKKLKIILGNNNNVDLLKGEIDIAHAARIGYTEDDIKNVLEMLKKKIMIKGDLIPAHRPGIVEYTYNPRVLSEILKEFEGYIPILQAILGNDEIIDTFNRLRLQPIRRGDIKNDGDIENNPEVDSTNLSVVDIKRAFTNIKDAIQTAPTIEKEHLDKILSNLGGSMERRKYRKEPNNIYCFYNLYPLYCYSNNYYFRYKNSSPGDDIDHIKYDKMLNPEENFDNNFIFSKHTLLKLYNKDNKDAFMPGSTQSNFDSRDKFKNLYYVIGRQNIFFDYKDKNNDDTYYFNESDMNDYEKSRMYGFNENSVLPNTVSLILFLTNDNGTFRNHLFYGLRIKKISNTETDDGKIKQMNAHYYFYILKPNKYPHIIIPGGINNNDNDVVLDNYDKIQNLKKNLGDRMPDSEFGSYIKELNDYLDVKSSKLTDKQQDDNPYCTSDFESFNTIFNFGTVNEKLDIDDIFIDKNAIQEAVHPFDLDKNMISDIKPFFNILYKDTIDWNFYDNVNIVNIVNLNYKNYIKINKYLFHNFRIEILLLNIGGNPKTIDGHNDDLVSHSIKTTGSKLDIPDYKTLSNSLDSKHKELFEKNTVINLYCYGQFNENKTFPLSFCTLKEFENSLCFYKNYYEKNIDLIKIGKIYDIDIYEFVDKLISDLLQVTSFSDKEKKLKYIYKIFIENSYLHKDFKITIATS
jgi:hypothetical protein